MRNPSYSHCAGLLIGIPCGSRFATRANNVSLDRFQPPEEHKLGTNRASSKSPDEREDAIVVVQDLLASSQNRHLIRVMTAVLRAGRQSALADPNLEGGSQRGIAVEFDPALNELSLERAHAHPS